MSVYRNNNLDSLLQKYVNNGMWKQDEDDSSYPEALNEVQKRFNIKKDTKVEGTGRPKSTPLPFYSHKADIFSENAENASLFEDATERDLEIGILERLNRNSSPIVNTSSGISAYVEGILTESLKIIRSEISPKEIIRLNRKKNRGGNIEHELMMAIFNNHCVVSLENMFRRNILFAHESPEKSDIYTGVKKVVLDSLCFINDSITMVTNQKLPQIVNNSNDEIVDMFKRLIYHSKQLSYTSLNKLICETNDRMFEFSEYICREISGNISRKLLSLALRSVTAAKYIPGYSYEVDKFKEDLIDIIMEELFKPVQSGMTVSINESQDSDDYYLGDFVDLPDTRLKELTPRNIKCNKTQWR